jgi:hypothetical protein
MTLPQVFEIVRPAVVAFSPKYIPGGMRPSTAPIIGTGFIVGEGLAVTNDHVIDALLRLPRPSEVSRDDIPFTASLFHFIEKSQFPNAPTDGLARIPLEVLGFFKAGDLQFAESGYYYGPRRPDFSIVHLKAKGLPSISLMPNASNVTEGTEVATLGYPTGLDLLAAPGWLHQIGPTLQRGIISGILPFRCAAPHGFLIEVSSLGGASGSPVFLTDDPRAIGVLHAGFQNAARTFMFDHGGVPLERDYVNLPTALSYVLPAFFIEAALRAVSNDQRFPFPPDTKSLDEMLASAGYVVMKEKGEHNEPPAPEDVVMSGTPEIAVSINTQPPSTVGD